jgi:hypothetical protein
MRGCDHLGEFEMVEDADFINHLTLLDSGFLLTKSMTQYFFQSQTEAILNQHELESFLRIQLGTMVISYKSGEERVDTGSAREGPSLMGGTALADTGQYCS